MLTHLPSAPNTVQRETFGVEPRITDEITMQKFSAHKAHKGQVNALVVSRQGLSAFTAGADGRVVHSRIIKATRKDNPEGQIGSSAATAIVETDVLVEGSKPIFALSLSPDQRFLAIARVSSVVIYDTKDRRLVHELTQIEGRISSICWDPRGELLAIGRANGDMFVWSVFSGNFAGADDKRAIEGYYGASSPIVKILFYPTGGAFFAAERSGTIRLWRLLRTERDMGLRDETAKIDEKRLGDKKEIVAILPSRIEDAWLNPEGTALYVASGSRIYGWKVRGLQALFAIELGRQAIFSIAGIEAPIVNGITRSMRVIASVDRSHKFSFWCEPIVAEVSSSEPDSQATLDRDFKFVASTQLLRDPIHLLAGGRDSSLLWAAQKTGNLLTFDSHELLTSPLWRSRALDCA